VNPGEVLAAEFLEPVEISQNQLAVTIDIPPLGSTSSCTANADCEEPVRVAHDTSQARGRDRSLAPRRDAGEGGLESLGGETNRVGLTE